MLGPQKAEPLTLDNLLQVIEKVTIPELLRDLNGRGGCIHVYLT